MNIQEGIKQVTSNQDLEQNEMFAITTQILEGSATDAQIGAFIIALSMKGETVEEEARSKETAKKKGIQI